MKNKKNLNLIVSIVCFLLAVAFAVVYAFWKNETVRILSALGFTACFVVLFKMLLEFLKDISFGKKLFAPFKKLFTKLYKSITARLGIDDDKIYLEGKRDEFKIKIELFKSAPKEKARKAPPRLPKYSSLKTDKARVRHIYTVFLKKRAERGYNVKPTLTSEEISADFAGNEKAQLLFELYPQARYSAENEPLEIADLKKLEELM